MSDTQRDREERQHVIEILQKEKKTALHDNKWAFDYAIASIETDLKYDLLYEETSEQADKPTIKNDVPDINVGKIDCSNTDCNNCVNHKYCDYESNCSEIPTGSTTKDNLGVDCISRTDAIHAVSEALERTFVEHEDIANKLIGKLPSVTQLSSGLDKNSKKLEKDFGELDCISRQAVQTRLKEIINEMETIFADIREREVDDSVCGLCEYDCDHGLDGYANECPGFEKDDCFKLNEKYKAEWLDISNFPPVTPQEPRKGHWIENAPEYQNIDPPYICSECGNMHLRKTNYCDQCGAKMVEPQESEG